MQAWILEKAHDQESERILILELLQERVFDIWLKNYVRILVYKQL